MNPAITIMGQLANQQLPLQTPPAQHTQDPKQALLAQLHDIHTPISEGYWPPAPGWWMVFFALLFGCFFLGRQQYRRRQTQRYRKQALTELRTLKQQPVGSFNEASQHVQQVMTLLKRVFFAAYPHNKYEAASATKATWLQLLENTCSKPLNTRASDAWFTYLYASSQHATGDVSAETQPHIEALYQLADVWIRHHQPNALAVAPPPTVTQKAVNPTVATPTTVGQKTAAAPTQDTHTQEAKHVSI